jgi:hypothetical protein
MLALGPEDHNSCNIIAENSPAPSVAMGDEQEGREKSAKISGKALLIQHPELVKLRF